MRWEKKVLRFFVSVLPLMGSVGVVQANEKAIPLREYQFQEDSKDEIFVNDKYRSGVHLIYDCLERYFVCVDVDSFQACRKARETERKLGQHLYLPCAPLKKFDNRVACLQAQYQQIQRPGNLSLCLNRTNKVK